MVTWEKTTTKRMCFITVPIWITKTTRITKIFNLIIYLFKILTKTLHYTMWYKIDLNKVVPITHMHQKYKEIQSQAQNINNQTYPKNNKDISIPLSRKVTCVTPHTAFRITD